MPLAIINRCAWPERGLVAKDPKWKGNPNYAQPQTKRKECRHSEVEKSADAVAGKCTRRRSNWRWKSLAQTRVFHMQGLWQGFDLRHCQGAPRQRRNILRGALSQVACPGAIFYCEVLQVINKMSTYSLTRRASASNTYRLSIFFTQLMIFMCMCQYVLNIENRKF